MKPQVCLRLTASGRHCLSCVISVVWLHKFELPAVIAAQSVL